MKEVQNILLPKAQRTGDGVQDFAIRTSANVLRAIPMLDQVFKVTVSTLGTTTLSIILKEWNKAEQNYTQILSQVDITATGDTVIGTQPHKYISDKIRIEWTQTLGTDITEFSIVQQGIEAFEAMDK